MKPHCLIMVKYILPALRAKVAEELIERGYRVKDAAEMLGLTQAAVSQYIRSKRGQKGKEIIEKSKKACEIIDELVNAIIARRATMEDEVDYLCKICEVLREEGIVEDKYAV
ncbi:MULTISPECIES: transcriptional regulator [unclassified Archaeoglobus]|uniref:transcriptional regulator n=1 Tax=unclassified Archaeoglobus TaxID=2643606 RepID=UPI0025B950D9|nr:MULTISPECIES: transcriptional regulator [unclassified Archaeoglobus]